MLQHGNAPDRGGGRAATRSVRRLRLRLCVSALCVLFVRGGERAAAAPPDDTQTLPIDLPTALRLVETANPTIAAARARVAAAYAQLDQANLLWLPNLQSGTTYVRHDGWAQNQRG